VSHARGVADRQVIVFEVEEDGWVLASIPAPERSRSGRYRPRAMREVPIRDDTIRLGQLLKLAGLADSGSDAKDLLATGAVRVNGEPEERRGRQLRRGDVVEADGERIRVS